MAILKKFSAEQYHAQVQYKQAKIDAANGVKASQPKPVAKSKAKKED
ncbi:virion protein [Proteus phage vB_PmiP_RS8pmA]|uniref:Virion protein n=1 Tax=Proteus phage vB_PmiP_RS8pmA TaxID=2250314 RepID=A0A514CY96_9CAUD|nr:virion protein [Proteus phage vB_PmiP_RS8pmA]